MTDNILQDLTFYDYSDIEIEYTIKTKVYSIFQLTDILNIDPTRGFSVNENYESKQFNTNTKQVEKTDRQRPYTLWVINTKSLTQSNRFEEHADQLLNLLNPQLDNIKKFIADKDSFEIIAFIYMTFNKEEHFGFGSKSTLFRQFIDISHYIEWRIK
ncbi:DUF4279 domain-containing protein [Flavihumibacter stibioxidans]|uniref:DUF4279 domain-containing protein n=1 Tax=Flavihumibacter stibioxidans TaxID=1834163 RepID=A0ABR7M6P8_9BACT|nr:DUF4279 domain-containing protein [Flavihumibacter stibioxidans]MBC6490692.1 hypothetical protein [Flavihumibacter stibioxidans]